MAPATSKPLARGLGFADAVVIGLGSMIGAGVFSAFGPAAAVGGTGLLLGLAIAAIVAYCNATSSARLAARYPASGGSYVYGRQRLGAFAGYLAGWAFVVGKIASCAAIALTFGGYLAGDDAKPVAMCAVLAITVVNYLGVRKSLGLTRILLTLTLLALAGVVVGCLAGGHASSAHLAGFPGGFSGASALGSSLNADVLGVLRSAGLLFFAFAGYARIATLGEEVREPRRTIPLAIPVALGLALLVYATVAVAGLLALGPHGLASTATPLVDAVRTGRWHALTPAVRVGAAIAALGSLLALLLGVSRTVFAMARNRDLPGMLDAVHPKYEVPHRAELAVGLLVAVLAGTVDLRPAIGFSSFGVLCYYAIANASALTLGPDEGRPPRWIPVLGLLGCVLLAGSLPSTSTIAGAGVLAFGALIWLGRRLLVNRRKSLPRKEKPTT
ncbi:MAG: amino acid permease [Sciscionella sp.]|nr:amino acid permease [Sciscionella sp.]